MQNPPDVDGLFGSFVNVDRSSALNEANVPIADWRFLPRRMDVDYRASSITLRSQDDGVPSGTSRTEPCQTLYFG